MFDVKRVQIKKKIPIDLSHRDLREVMLDHKLAALGDAYVNFAYSMALSCKKGEAMGARANGRVLADALKRAGLRNFLPSRMDRHKQANAAEALIVYAWIRDLMSLEESVNTLRKHEDETEAFYFLLLKAKKKLESETFGKFFEKK